MGKCSGESGVTIPHTEARPHLRTRKEKAVGEDAFPAVSQLSTIRGGCAEWEPGWPRGIQRPERAGPVPGFWG